MRNTLILVSTFLLSVSWYIRGGNKFNLTYDEFYEAIKDQSFGKLDANHSLNGLPYTGREHLFNEPNPAWKDFDPFPHLNSKQLFNSTSPSKFISNFAWLAKN